MYTQEAPTTPTSPATRGTAVHPAKRVGDISARLAGAGALTFAVTVVVQNLVRGATAPTMDASGRELLAHYSGHDLITYFLTATYVVSGIGIAAFLGGAMRRLTASNRPGWAFTGFVGATSIMALFAVVVAAEQALGVVAHQDNASVASIDALWALHNSVFTVLELAIATALVGLARAGVAAGFTPRVFDRLAPVGAGLLLVGTLAGPSIAGGNSMALFGVSTLGFVVWLAFVATTGLRLVRTVEERG